MTIFANKKKKQTKFYWLIKKYRKKLKILSAKYLENIISNLYAQKILEKIKNEKILMNNINELEELRLWIKILKIKRFYF